MKISRLWSWSLAPGMSTAGLQATEETAADGAEIWFYLVEGAIDVMQHGEVQRVRAPAAIVRYPGEAFEYVVVETARSMSFEIRYDYPLEA
jgi:hypothetical protein